ATGSFATGGPGAWPRKSPSRWVPEIASGSRRRAAAASAAPGTVPSGGLLGLLLEQRLEPPLELADAPVQGVQVVLGSHVQPLHDPLRQPTHLLLERSDDAVAARLDVLDGALGPLPQVALQLACVLQQAVDRLPSAAGREGLRVVPDAGHQPLALGLHA